ncbi:hypothetical protein RRG08_004322 [Elysia crispata]|uniref:Uncharacterized protein n=1 Tax=Elysia crispata TaxID=231223 RepID=A0AAE0YCV8_9GAST|nr:hypothetical protein RRG08_004322 [Elysia crispata]
MRNWASSSQRYPHFIYVAEDNKPASSGDTCGQFGSILISVTASSPDQQRHGPNLRTLGLSQPVCLRSLVHQSSWTLVSLRGGQLTPKVTDFWLVECEVGET